MANGKKGVRSTHKDYDAYEAKWQRCRDAAAGEDAVKAAGTKYLPKLKRQTEEEYQSMKTRASFYNATGRTIEALTGMMFRKPPITEVPSALDVYIKDVDMCGKPLEVFAQEVAEECVKVNRVGVLVDYTQNVTNTEDGRVLTKAEAELLNLRPFMKIYTTESIINWRFKQINNVWTLNQVVLTEQYEFPAIDEITKQPSEFENAVETRYRVLDLFNDTAYRVRIFRINAKDEDEQVGSDQFPLLNNLPLDFIPFVVMTSDGLGFKVDDPTLLDLVNVNMSHWRSSADYEHGCHFTALPTLFVAGYSPLPPKEGEPPEEIYLGSQTAIVSNDSNAKANFIEFTGNGLGTIEKNMDRKENHMAILGAKMLSNDPKKVEAAETTQLKRTGEDSILASVAIQITLGLQQALNWFSLWAGVTNADCKYELTRKYMPSSADGPMLTAMVGAYQGGTLTKEELFDWMQEADLIDNEVDFAKHLTGEFAALPVTPPVEPVGSPA